MNSLKLISSDYLAQQKLMHASPRGYGHSGYTHASEIQAVIKACGWAFVTLLDYGAGAGTLRRELIGQGWPSNEVRNYDPAVAGMDGAPKFASVVTCTDVLEHIEPELIDNVLMHIFSLAQAMIFLCISTQPAHKTLSDGRNAHLIIESPDWWISKIVREGWKIQSQFIRYNIDGAAELSLWLTREKST